MDNYPVRHYRNKITGMVFAALPFGGDKYLEQELPDHLEWISGIIYTRIN